MKHLNTYSILATSLKSTVTVHTKPEVAAESTMHNLFVHNGLIFRNSSPVLFCVHSLIWGPNLEFTKGSWRNLSFRDGRL